MRLFLAVSAMTLVMCSLKSYADVNVTPFDSENIPEVKQTLSGKYLTSSQAHERLLADDSILFIDVRDSVEIGLSGHPVNIDAIVPLQIQTNRFNDELNEFHLAENPTFLNEMEAVLEVNSKTKNDMLIVTCGSGMRSAMAANKLIRAGYTNVWHIPDGYQGDDKIGINRHNAWKLSELPWTKDLVYGSEWRILMD